MICRNKRKEGRAGLEDRESQRSKVFASQEKMKFKEKIIALGTLRISPAFSESHSVRLFMQIHTNKFWAQLGVLGGPASETEPWGQGEEGLEETAPES